MTALKVLYEDNHLLVVDKPAGVLVQGDKTGDAPIVETAKNYLKEKYHKPGSVFLGTVHRLDRPVSGVLVLARTSKALSRLNEQFKNRAIKKTYWALTADKPPANAGTLEHWLVKDHDRNKTQAHYLPVEGAKKAVLEYKLLKSSKGIFILEIYPLTGRSHQIRVQLASMGCPILGDLKYGSRRPNSDGNICLHAREISFIHPVGRNELKIAASLPETKEWNSFKGL